MIHYVTTTGIGNAWVANELRVIQAARVPFVLHAMRGPQQMFFRSGWAAELAGSTLTMYPLPVGRTLAAVAAAAWKYPAKFLAAVCNAVFGRRESLRSRLSCAAHFVVACYWVSQVKTESISHIHAQWAHSSGSIAMYAAWLLGKSFSFTGHAADLFRERVALRDKIRRAEFIICISRFHREFYLNEGARPEQLKVAYCGIDLEQFKPVQHLRRSAEDGVLRIRSSGRLVEKKGFAILIDACRLLAEQGVVFECIIGGSGPLESDLRRRVAAARLGERVFVTGRAIKQEEIPEFMGGGDLFCLPCVWASDDDVDGLPQMLMEALACGLPIISTRLVGIPDLIQHERTGLLVEPNNAEQLADAILQLGRDPELARRLAEAGRQHLKDHFDLSSCLEPLIQEYRKRLGMPMQIQEAHRSPREMGAVGATK